MPFLVPAVIAAAATVGISAATGTLVAGTALAVFGKSLIVYAGLSALSQALAKKPRTPEASSYTAEARERTQVIRSSVQARRLVFGQALISGPLVYAQVTGGSNEYMHKVIALCEGEVEAIDAVYFDQDKLPAGDVNGNITSGVYANHARVRTYTGTAAQTADGLLVSESSGKWTSDHRLRGVAYVYARLLRNDDIYKSGLPQIRAVVRGVKCYDPRDGQTRWTSNPALILRHYLTASYGLSCSNDEIDDAAVAAAANACDERVAMASYGVGAALNAGTDVLTLSSEDRRIATGDGVQVTTTGTLAGTGLSTGVTYYVIRLDQTTLKLATTYANALAGVAIDITGGGSGLHTLQHIDQARYTCNGSVTLDQTPRDIVQQILQTMMGALVWSGGKYIMHAGVWSSPTVTLDEDDLRGPVTVQPRPGRQDLFNGVRGTYVSPLDWWQVTDFPPVTNSTYESQDGGAQILRDLEMPMVTDVTRAQRIAKLNLARARSAETLIMPCKLTALALQPWDTVTVNISRLGYSGKTFRVVGWQLTQADGALGVDLTLQAETSGVYGWSATDAAYVAPPPRLDAPPQPYEGGAVAAVGVLPGGATEGEVVYLTTDDKLYRYNGTAWVTWVDGSDILAASITAGKLATKTITAASAVIDDAAINTLQIAGQAVTIPVSAKSDTPATVGAVGVVGNESIFRSFDVPGMVLSVNSTGAPIHIMASCDLQTTNAHLFQMEITRNGVVIMTIWPLTQDTVYWGNKGYASMQCVDVPGAGTHVYKVRAAIAYKLQNYIFGVRSMTALETKR